MGHYGAGTMVQREFPGHRVVLRRAGGRIRRVGWPTSKAVPAAVTSKCNKTYLG